MGMLSGLFKSRDKPMNRTNGSAYSFLMGGSSSGRRVNERSAMQMTAVYSCVRILSEAVASLPLHHHGRQSPRFPKVGFPPAGYCYKPAQSS